MKNFRLYQYDIKKILLQHHVALLLG